jgi:hypothetical protein
MTVSLSFRSRVPVFTETRVTRTFAHGRALRTSWATKKELANCCATQCCQSVEGRSLPQFSTCA